MLKIIGIANSLVFLTCLAASQLQLPVVTYHCDNQSRCEALTAERCELNNTAQISPLSDLFNRDDSAFIPLLELPQQHVRLQGHKTVKSSLLSSKTFAVDFPVR